MTGYLVLLIFKTTILNAIIMTNIVLITEKFIKSLAIGTDLKKKKKKSWDASHTSKSMNIKGKNKKIKLWGNKSVMVREENQKFST